MNNVVIVATPVFYFDFNSPYAYLAAERIGDLIPEAEWRPIAFPVLLQQLGRLETALARDFSIRAAEVSERAAQRGLPPFNPPIGWPLQTWSLVPLRASLIAGGHDLLHEFSAAVFRKTFVDGLSSAELDTVREAAREVGLDPDEVEDGIQRPGIKQRLKDHTEEAHRRGVTGIPTVAIDDELFWGDDHLDEAAAARAAIASTRGRNN
jgi:2-hydroxychromene-2-carboxylate isomerase